jgi:DNA-binding PadR family transcriptional regulator
MYSRRYVSERHHGPMSAHHHRSGRGPRGRGGPRARRGDIRAAALALLAEKPMHGYEMIQEVEERSGGYWRPSAGSIYPTLQLLEDEGLIVGEESDGKRRFTLTEEGKAQASERAEKSGSLPWEQVRTSARPETVHLGQSLRQLAEAASQALRVGDESQQARIRELLDETRRGIYSILAEESEAQD